MDFQCGMVALAPETGGGFKIVRKAEWGESGVVPPSGHSLLPATNFFAKILRSQLCKGCKSCKASKMLSNA